MGSSSKFAEFIVDQFSDIDDVSTRPMFGEYAVCVENKVVGFTCNDDFLVKVTDDGLGHLKEQGIEVQYGKPSPAGRDYILITSVDDRDSLLDLIRITARALPEPPEPVLACAVSASGWSNSAGN